MKKILFALAAFVLAVSPLSIGRAHALSGVVFTVSPTGTQTSPVTLTASIVNNSGAPIVISGAQFIADVSDILAISSIVVSMPGGWTPGGGNGYNSGSGRITAVGTHAAATIADGGSLAFASFTVTFTDDFTLDFQGTGFSAITEDVTGTNLWDVATQTASWPYLLAIPTNTPVPATGAPTAVHTTAPRVLAGTGPEDSITMAVIAGLALVSSLFFVIRARRAWKASK